MTPSSSRRVHSGWASGLGLGLAALVLAGPGVPPAAADGAGFWRSLLIPGWGQQVAGRHDAAARFLAVEAGLWAGWAGLRAVADVRQTTYRTWAAVHAGARPQGKSKEYFDDLGFYLSQQEHNRFALVEAGPGAQLYADTPEFAWAWDTPAARSRYRQLRNDAEGMDRDALYLTGLIAVNHLVAAVHAARTGRGGPRLHDRDRPGLGLRGRPRPGGGLELALMRRF